MSMIIIEIHDRLRNGNIEKLYVSRITHDRDGNISFQTSDRENALVLDQASHLETIKKIADAVFDFMLIPYEQTYVGMRLIEV